MPSNTEPCGSVCNARVGGVQGETKLALACSPGSSGWSRSASRSTSASVRCSRRISWPAPARRRPASSVVPRAASSRAPRCAYAVLDLLARAAKPLPARTVVEPVGDAPRRGSLVNEHWGITPAARAPRGRGIPVGRRKRRRTGPARTRSGTSRLRDNGRACSRSGRSIRTRRIGRMGSCMRVASFRRRIRARRARRPSGSRARRTRGRPSTGGDTTTPLASSSLLLASDPAGALAASECGSSMPAASAVADAVPFVRISVRAPQATMHASSPAAVRLTEQTVAPRQPKRT